MESSPTYGATNCITNAPTYRQVAEQQMSGEDALAAQIAYKALFERGEGVRSLDSYSANIAALGHRMYNAVGGQAAAKRAQNWKKVRIAGITLAAVAIVAFVAFGAPHFLPNFKPFS